ncbi:3-hydroxyacyl-CoA dehydrogenase family protein [Streptomyces violascens]|uniref:3-hydroxyacyl-CoA dehydrogenase family protein n=1 Tax=Streptomyces violascens TaxID=67381 RepID=UPI0036893EF3
MTTGDIATAAVVGLGGAGAELARRLSAAGVPTLGVEADAAAAERGRERLAGTDVRVTHDLREAGAADVVIEAVPDTGSANRAVLSGIARHGRPDALVVTTALTATAAELAGAGRPDLLALRFLDAERLTAVELAAAPGATNRSATAFGGLLQRTGLKVHQVPDRPGSIAPALVFGILNQAAWMHQEGRAGTEELETAVRLGCGWRQGPLRILDGIGLDTAKDVLDGLHRRLGPRFEPAPVLGRLIGRGDLGRKSGRGFHDYRTAPVARQPVRPGPPSPPAGPGTVAVVGSGTMATGIAEVFLRAGYRTVLVARTEAKAAAAAEAVELALPGAAPAPGETRGTLTSTADRSVLARADLVVEAVIEDRAVKRALFAELGAVCKPQAVLATTTSSLPVRDCAEASGRPGDVVGLHFFNPAPMMPLVEVVRSERTGERALATAHDVVRRLGKTGVECADRTGFLVNYLLFPYLNDALALLDHDVVGPQLLDGVAKSVGGQPIGPTRLLDTVGADVALAVQRRLHEDYGRAEFAPPPLLEELVATGHLGRKCGWKGVRAYLAAREPAAVA